MVTFSDEMAQMILDRLNSIENRIDILREENKEAHGEYSKRLQVIEQTCAERKSVIEQTKQHLQSHKDPDDWLNGKIARIALLIVAAVGGCLLRSL